ncbi:hypothetical protein [Hymenobacter siberiensis]|uniref:hypothetical protein n=1 Tax=Hymenobacter siberiensis TaxID=2848396 RepID=UPI001C1E7990|nr:hypothetical protein [Hymenobacter siberiensis]
MPTSTFLNSAFGGVSQAKFEMGGIAELYLLPLKKIANTVNVVDAFGATTSVTDINLVDPLVKFQEIGFVEGSASYTDAFKPSNTKRYMELSLNFTVDASGDAAIAQAHQIQLTHDHVALVKRKNGKWYLLGKDFGLKVSDGNANSGAKREDDSAMTFTLVGGNLGHAAEVIMPAIELAAILNRVA